jgi:drug/metabolite transporter (DMT)-like permease
MSPAGRYFAGVGCVLGYIAIASSQSVALNSWLASENVYLVAGLSFGLVESLFIAITLGRSGTAAYRFVREHRARIVALNVAATFNWLFYFLAVKYLPPAVAVTLTQGIGPLSMTAYNLVRGWPVSRVTRICHAVILVVAALMCWYVVDHRLTTGSHSRAVLAVAIGIGIVCSISITATVILSGALAQAKVPASAVLSIRFPLLIVTCLAVLPTQRGMHLSAGLIAIVAAVALLGVASAAYLLQRGVELAPALAVSTCLALSPVVVFAIGGLRSHSGANLTVLALIGVIVAVSTTSILYDGSRLRSAGSAPADLLARAIKT